MVTQPGGDCLRRTWRLSIDVEQEMWRLVPTLPMTLLDNVSSESITGAIRTDAIVLAGSVSWLLPRVERIRQVGLCYLPLLALTDAASTDAIMSLIERGADDALVAPVDSAMMITKLHALNRRGSGTFLKSRSDLVLRPDSHTVEILGKAVRLRPTPFRLLAYLVANREEWVAKDQILKDVFGLNRDPGTSLVRVHIHAIRRGLGAYAGCVRDDPGRNRGYMFTLTAVDAADGKPAENTGR